MAHPLKKSERKREEPKLGEPKLGEPKLVEPDSTSEITIAQELQGESVSDTLIRARQQIGQDLRSIAEVLCIRYSYLDAIERGQYENLPGATYAVGFVRSYAEYLGLDGDQVVERFKNEVEGLDSQTKLHFPTPAPEGKMPGGAVFLVAALLFAGAYGVWFYLSNKGESLSDLVAPVPERLQELVDGDAPAATAETGTAVTLPQGTETSSVEANSAETAPAETSPVETGPAEPAPQAAIEPAVEPAAAPAPAPAPATPVAEAAPAASEAPAAEETPAAPSAPATVAAAPSAAQAEEAVASAPASTAPAESAASETSQEAVQQAAVAPEAPAATAPAAEAPARNEPYAIPAAPDNNTPATAFLTNHQPQVYGEENADARIVLKATQDAWVQVRDRQGTLLLTRVLRVGDTYRVPNQQDLTLLTGNAGGLEITVDGRALPPLGPVGAVRRNIPLNPESLAGAANR